MSRPERLDSPGPGLAGAQDRNSPGQAGPVEVSGAALHAPAGHFLLHPYFL